MTNSQEKFRVGINYWPRRKAMFWWSHFDTDEVKTEFDIIQQQGLDLVRIFLLWEDWQPQPGKIASRMMHHFETVCTIAEERGLELDVTFFTGHMSGPSWVPSWMLQRQEPRPPRVLRVVSGGYDVNCGYTNPYTDPQTVDAAELLLHEVVREFKDHPAIGIWNLGNEPDLFAWPPDAQTGRNWVRRMTGLIKELDTQHPVTCGLHVESLIQDNGLRVNDVFSEVDIAVMHGYPMYAEGWARDPLDPDFVPFLCALTSALCGKPTLMEEFGGCTEAPGNPSSTWEWTAYGQPRKQFMASERDFAAYIEQVLPKLVEVGASGALLWCFADYAPSLYTSPPCDEAWHERFFGLIRPDGSLKPHAGVLKAFAEKQPLVQPARRRLELDIEPEEYYERPQYHAVRLYRAFLD